MVVDPNNYRAMDMQMLQYWQVQNNWIALQNQDIPFDMVPELSKVPSLDGSPAMPTLDQFGASLTPNFIPQIVDEPLQFNSQPLSLPTSDFGSDAASPQHSPEQNSWAEPTFAVLNSPDITERKHATSGRRRAQNRAAQRAFRERKEKHARDLEDQLAVMSAKYTKLEASHMELNSAYEKLRKTLDILVADDDAMPAGDKGADSFSSRRASASAETWRKLLDVLHGEVKEETLVKKEIL